MPLTDVKVRNAKPEEKQVKLINRMALYCGYKGDEAREERLYAEASAADPTLSTPWFNLALLLHRQKRLAEAKHAIEIATGIDPERAPYYVLQGQIVRDMEKTFAMPEFLNMAHKCFRPLSQLDKWELGWYIAWAEMQGDSEALTAARQERQRRNVGPQETSQETGGLLPAMVA